MSKFVFIELHEMRKTLAAYKGWKESIVGSEYVFDFYLKSTDSTIRVFSSIRTDTQESRAKGQDAIRVCVIKKRKSVRVYRTVNWKRNLHNRVMELFKTFSKAPMKRITRDRYLTPEEAAKYNKIREQVKEELPQLIEEHHKRMEQK